MVLYVARDERKKFKIAQIHSKLSMWLALPVVGQADGQVRHLPHLAPAWRHLCVDCDSGKDNCSASTGFTNFSVSIRARVNRVGKKRLILCGAEN